MTGNDQWMTAALCRKAGTKNADSWYPEKSGNNTTARKAKQLCDVCPVKQRCIDYALAYDERWGIWGGVNLGQTRGRHRAEMRRERGVNLIAIRERTDAFLQCANDRRRQRTRKKDTSE